MSYMIYRTALFLMTLNDPTPSFKVIVTDYVLSSDVSP